MPGATGSSPRPPPGGATSQCEGVFVYRVRDDGKLVSLRAFWEVDRMMATLTQA